MIPITVLLVIIGFLAILPFAVPALHLEAVGYLLSARPDDYEAWTYYGGLLIKRGYYASAERALREALKLKPNYDEAWMRLGEMYRRLDMAEQAEDAFGHLTGDYLA